MSITVNVNGKLKKLTRIFFNDNGVIRELDSVYARNSNNEIKPIFTHESKIPNTLSWIAERISGITATINSVTNNGYTINAKFSIKNRGVATRDKIYLPVGTQIKMEVSNLEFNVTPATLEGLYCTIALHLYDTESFSETAQSGRTTTKNPVIYYNRISFTTSVAASGYYYIAPHVYGHQTPNVPTSSHLVTPTADVDITIIPPA